MAHKTQKGVSLTSVCFVTVILAAVLWAGWHCRNPILKSGLERGLNIALKDFFSDSIKLEDVSINEKLQISIAEIKADFQTPDAVFPVEMGGILLQDSAIHFVAGKPVLLTFEYLKPRNSVKSGIRGSVSFNNGKAGSVEFKGDVVDLGLEELTSLSPENLTGSSGSLKGEIFFKSNVEGAEAFYIKLHVDEPGGRLQSRFFDALKPYLPQVKYQDKLDAMRSTKTVGYQKAKVNIELIEPEKIKVLLKIQVPDYNLNFNLNVEVRVEEENSFLQLAGIMGLVKVGNEK